MEKLNELVGLAKKATSGEWVSFVSTVGEGTFSIHTPEDSRKGDIVNWPGFDTASGSKAQKKANAKYIAAANPATILAIAEALRALQRRAEAAEAKYSEVSDWYAKMKTRMLAAEAKLTELEKQEPMGRVDRGPVSDSNEYPDAQVVCLHEHVGWEAFQDGTELFLRPAPAINLAELVPDEATDSQFDGLSISKAKGWNACRAAILRNIEERTNGENTTTEKVDSLE